MKSILNINLRNVLLGVALIGLFAPAYVYAVDEEDAPDNDPDKLLISDPFIELRTGPGRGYPVFYVEERGQWIQLLKRRTDWYKIKLKNDKVGWVSMDQISNTLLAAGVEKSLRDSIFEDFFNRNTEVGFVGGSHAGFSFIGILGSRKLSDKFSLQFGYSEASEVFSTSKLINLDLVSHPFSDWVYSPYFALGFGKKIDTPIRTQVGQETTDTMTAHFGLGLRVYLTRNFVARTYYRRYAWFFDDVDTHSIDEYAVGVSFFF